MKAAVVLGEHEAVERSITNRLAMKSETVVEELPPTFDVLVLSGGGDYGAFGAGVLYGWGGVCDPQLQRPQFDVVTGVSTGALIAPMAFVGAPNDYERIFVLYQNPKRNWVRQRTVPAVVTGRPSLATNKGLTREVRETINCDLVRGIACGAEQHRLLLIETTNLDRGTRRLWNITAEAQRVTAGESLSRFQDIILASTSVPGAFPPVELDGDLHVDGGVSRNIVFSVDSASDTDALDQWRKQFPDRKPPTIRYWVIINGQLTTRPQRVRERWSDVSKRSVEMVIRSSTVQSLRSLEMRTQLMKIEGFDVELRYMAIPNDWQPPVEGSFKKETMVSLAKLGQKMGGNPNCWRTKAPGELDRIEADTRVVLDEIPCCP